MNDQDDEIRIFTLRFMGICFILRFFLEEHFYLEAWIEIPLEDRGLWIFISFCWRQAFIQCIAWSGYTKRRFGLMYTDVYLSQETENKKFQKDQKFENIALIIVCVTLAKENDTLQTFTFLHLKIKIKLAESQFSSDRQKNGTADLILIQYPRSKINLRI